MGAGRWAYGHRWYPERGEHPADYTPARCTALLRTATGLPDLEPEILSAEPFTMAAEMGTALRAGRGFLVGDAAHRMTATGGRGMNTAIHDGHETERAGEPSDAAFSSFGSWDAGGSWWFSNAHQWLERFDSHFLPAWNRSGSHIRMQIWNTDNRDNFDGRRNNGYLVEYRMPHTRPVTIRLGVTCAFTEHELYGDDEWDPSDCHAATIDRGGVRGLLRLG